MTAVAGDRDALASVIIPAHNERDVVGRLLTRLLGPGSDPATGPWFEIVVVCNGCTDDTADRARAFGPAVTVVELAQPSKQAALRRGDEVATRFPRVYVDADVETGAEDLVALIDALAVPGVLAAAPQRRIPYDRAGPLVRWYYDVWQLLPQVRDGLFGRGVIAVSEAGHRRIAALPPAMSDDLAVSEAFAPPERTVVAGAGVVVRPPATMRDLLRRRVRVHTGNAELDRRAGRAESSRTSIGDLLRLARAHPRLAPRLPVFLAVTVVAKIGARRRIRAGDYTTWLRDESSRRAD
jgi:hypothetical protein